MKKQYLVPTMEQSVLEPQGNLLQIVSGDTGNVDTGGQNTDLPPIQP